MSLDLAPEKVQHLLVLVGLAGALAAVQTRWLDWHADSPFPFWRAMLVSLGIVVQGNTVSTARLQQPHPGTHGACGQCWSGTLAPVGTLCVSYIPATAVFYFCFFGVCFSLPSHPPSVPSPFLPTQNGELIVKLPVDRKSTRFQRDYPAQIFRLPFLSRC